MTYGHLSSSYVALLQKIHKNKGVPCEWKPELWFPEDIEKPHEREIATATAKMLCKACPILKDCFSYALETNQRYGIWGGTEPDER